MLTHHRTLGDPVRRAVVIGSAGFVGAAAVRHLRSAGVEILALSRGEVDLLGTAAVENLANYLKPDDALVFAAAKAPCKDAAMLVENLRMAEVVCAAVKRSEIGHVVYVSSDAVYGDSTEPLTEASVAEPGSIHGVMHLAREVVLRAEFPGPLAILRPTLIYGLHDPHNGYGPNRFRRLAFAGSNIPIFGDGEERRDHVHIEDVARLLSQIVLQRSTGTLNAVSGEVASFLELAEFTAAQFDPRVEITRLPRTGPMPHNGYRAFNAVAISQAFPALRMTPWQEGIKAVCRAQQEVP